MWTDPCPPGLLDTGVFREGVDVSDWERARVFLLIGVNGVDSNTSEDILKKLFKIQY